MDTEQLSFGQRIDPENNLVECWFTHGALDEIKSMDLSDKVIVMYGGGLGDVWLASRCKELHVIERNSDWLDKISTVAANSPVYNLFYHFRPMDDCTGRDKEYLAFPNNVNPDVIISDDAYRTEAVRMAIDYFKGREGGGILVCDNYYQDYVWRSPVVLEWLEPFEKHTHSQPDHKDFETDGGEWKTAIIFIK
jgi:hypothetical protein